LRGLDARAVGVAAWRLGAGRARKEDPVSASAGVLCLAKPGERVEAGQAVLELRADDESRFARAREALAGGPGVRPPPPRGRAPGDRADCRGVGGRPDPPRRAMPPASVPAYGRAVSSAPAAGGPSRLIGGRRWLALGGLTALLSVLLVAGQPQRAAADRDGTG